MDYAQPAVLIIAACVAIVSLTDSALRWRSAYKDLSRHDRT